MKNMYFYYSPVKLINVNRKFDEKMSSVDALSSDYVNNIFLQLNTMNFEDAYSYQKKLKYSTIKEVLVCVKNNPLMVRSEIFFYIWLERFRRSLSDIVYEIFHNFYLNNQYLDVITPVLRKIQLISDNKDELIASFYKKDIIEFLIQKGEEMMFSTEKVLNYYRIDSQSTLGKDYQTEVLLHCNKEYIDSLSFQMVEQMMKQFTYDQHVTFVNHYFDIYTWREISESLIDSVIEIYGRKFDKSLFWDAIDDDIVNLFRKHFLKKAIDATLGSDERSSFWKNHIDKMIDVKVNDENQVLYLFFNDFVVVEFIKIGNAAYFYNYEVFNSKFLKYIDIKRKVYPSTLKDPSLCIYKVNHSKGWKYNLDLWLSLRG